MQVLLSAVGVSGGANRSGSTVSMLDDWIGQHKVIYHKHVPKVHINQKSVFETTACFRCGVCVCGRSEASKPDVGFALAKLIQVLKKAMWRKKQKMSRSRAHLEAGQLVLVMTGSHPAPGLDSVAAATGFSSDPGPGCIGDSGGPKPGVLEESGQCLVAHVSADPIATTQSHFFHPGQVNYKTWNFALARLTKIQDVNDFGHLEVEAASGSDSDHGIMTIAEFLASDAVALASCFHVAAHAIVADKQLLPEDRMRPQILELRREPLFSELFWEGAEEEKRKREAAARRKRLQREPGGPQPKKPRTGPKGKPQPKSKAKAKASAATSRDGLGVGSAAMEDDRNDPDEPFPFFDAEGGNVSAAGGAEEDALDLLQNLLKAEQGADEDRDDVDHLENPEEGDTFSHISATTEGSEAANDSADDGERIANLVSCLEQDVADVQPDMGDSEGSCPYSPSLGPSPAEGAGSPKSVSLDEDAPLGESKSQSMAMGSMAAATTETATSAFPPADGGSAGPHIAESINAAASSSSTALPAPSKGRPAGPTGPRPKPKAEARRASITELSIDVVPWGIIRYNLSDNFFRAICQCEGHVNCQRKRTAAAGRHPGQGRPLGGLVAWLQSGDKHPSRKEHIEAPAEPLEDRTEGRKLFKDIDDDSTFLSLERDRRPGEPEEPDSIS